MNTSYTKKSQEIIFHDCIFEADDLYRYLKKEDVLTLLNRLPLKEYEHLKSVTFKTCEGADAYGFVYHRRPTSIVICDQSARTSIRNATAKRGSLEEFGALNNRKWPTLALRRYLLYHTFLHELRHTQLLENGKKRTRDKMPLEKQADEYADHWRGELYQNYFKHPDPIHNLPSKTEKECLRKYWPTAMDFLQKGMRFKNRKDTRNALLNYEKAIKHIELYHGEFPIEYEDIKKLGSTVRRLRYRQFYINLGIASDDRIYKQVRELLIQSFDIKILEEQTYQDVFRLLDFEFQLQTFSFFWHKDQETKIEFRHHKKCITEQDLNQYDEMRALVKLVAP